MNKKELDVRAALVTKAAYSKRVNLSIPVINYKVKIGALTQIEVNGAKLIKVADLDTLRLIDFKKVYTSAALARKIGVLRQTIKHNQDKYYVLKLEDRDLFYVP